MNDDFGEDFAVYFDSDDNDECFEIALKNAVNEEHKFAVPKSVGPEVAEHGSSKQESTESEWEKPSTSSSSTDNGSDFNFGGELFYSGSEAEGFFIPSGSSYYYPTNFPVREYQKSIIETALFNNTLVVLPTGLGKTFIAAVVMYNFYRWYPRGLIVFMAPTRPLVAQQISACTDIMGIPASDIIEITGKSNKKTRMDSWKEKRVFFLTPHVMVNDIDNNYCDPSRVRCIVVDEAHKAMGNYSYCQVVRQLKDYLLKFRIVALSATPGNNLEAYQEVIHNLNIAKIQVRSEDSPDVVKYIHGRKLTHIVLKLDDTWKQFQDKFLELYEDYSRVLKDHNIVRGNICNLTAFQIRTLMESFKNRKDLNKDVKQKCNMSLLACSTLAHGNMLMYHYGFKALYSHFTGDSDSHAMPFIRKNEKLHSLLRAIDLYLKDNGSPVNYVCSHPKYTKLREVVANHFSSTEQIDGKNDSKVIIYCQFRIGVVEAHAALTELEPLIRPVMFIGQSSGKKGGTGLGQKMQLDILQNFKSGKFNTLIATCIGEEGLDIGEVDLIICLDALTSITRHIQRIGRTGRKRAGACVFLVTEGKEEAKLQKCLSASSNFAKMINPSLLNTSVTGANPRMVPKHIKPRLHFVHIKPNKESKADQKKTKAKTENDEEPDEEASTSKGAPKRKKAAAKNEEKKEKPNKKAKLENPPAGKTLFSYFPKKNFESFHENDAETKDVFSTPKDKQSKSKSKAPELSNIAEDDCAIIEDNFEENFVNDALPVFEGDTNTCHVNLVDAQEALFNDISTAANNSENGNDIEHMFSLFRNWVTNYAQNDNVLFDENFFQLLRLFMKKPSDPVPTVTCDPVNNPRDSSLVDFDINFDSSSDESESPEILPRKAPHSSPVMLEQSESPEILSRKAPHSSPVKLEPPSKIDSPILSCNKVKPILSPVHFIAKDVHLENDFLAIPHAGNAAPSSSTPKIFSKFKPNYRRDNQMSDIFAPSTSTPYKPISTGVKEESTSVLNGIGNEFCPKEEIKIENNQASPPPSVIEDLDSTSPLILTCKISKPVNSGRSKRLFPDENFQRNDVCLVSECNTEQTKKEPCESPKQFLSDSFDLFEEDSADFPPLSTADVQIPQDEILTQKENNAPNFNLKTEVPQESVAKPSLFTTVHSEKSKWFVTPEKPVEKPKNLDSFEALASELEAFSESKTAANKIPNTSNSEIKNNDSDCKKSVESGRKQTGSPDLARNSKKDVSDFFDDSLFDDYFVNSAIKARNKSSKPANSLNRAEPGLFSGLAAKSYKPISIVGSKVEKVDSEFSFLNPKMLSKSLSTKTSTNLKKNLFSSVKSECKNTGLDSEGSKKKQDEVLVPKINAENRLFKDDSGVKDKLLASRNPRHESNNLKNAAVPVSSKSSDSNKINLKSTGAIKVKENNIETPKMERNLFKSRDPANLVASESRHVKFNGLKVRENAPTLKSDKNLHESRPKKPESLGSSNVERNDFQQSTSKNEEKNLSPLFDSDDDLFFERPRPVKPKTSEEKPPKRTVEKDSVSVAAKKPKKKRNDFIEWEAEVSGSDFSEDEHEADDDMNHVPDSFIHDGHNTIFGHENTMMAQYLESVRSPPRVTGRFKIPVLPDKIDVDVFSQTFHNDADYQNDSFCVDEEISDYGCSEDEDSFDINPKKNSKKLTKRKRTVDDSNEGVILISSSSDEEVVYIPSDDETPYAKKKPTRRKVSHSEKFSKLKKVMEAKKSKNKIVAGPSKEEPSWSSKNGVRQNPQVEREEVQDQRDSDTDFDDFLPKPSGSRANVSSKQTSHMEMSVIGKKGKKKAKLNLFSSDED